MPEVGPGREAPHWMPGRVWPASGRDQFGTARCDRLTSKGPAPPSESLGHSVFHANLVTSLIPEFDEERER